MKLYANLPLPNGEVKIMFEGSFQDADFDSLNDYWKQILQSARGRARHEASTPPAPVKFTPYEPVGFEQNPVSTGVNPTFKPVEPKVDWTE